MLVKLNTPATGFMALIQGRPRCLACGDNVSVISAEDNAPVVHNATSTSVAAAQNIQSSEARAPMSSTIGIDTSPPTVPVLEIALAEKPSPCIDRAVPNRPILIAMEASSVIATTR